MYFVIALTTLLAGFIQGVSGFGGGIVIMSILPYFMSVVSSATLSGFLNIFLCLIMTIRYRRGINFRLILLPAVFFMIGSITGIFFVTSIDTGTLKIILGVFLSVLAVYFMIFSSRIHLKATLPTMITCGLVSGILDGFFAIGGPPMVLYFLALTKKKEEYLGTNQCFFLIMIIISFSIRCIRGLVTPELVSYAPIGLLFILLGGFIGGKVINYINDELLRKLTYALLGVSGIVISVTTALTR